MSCSCKRSGSKKQPAAIKQVVKTVSSNPVSTPRVVAKPAAKRVIIRRPI